MKTLKNTNTANNSGPSNRDNNTQLQSNFVHI